MRVKQVKKNEQPCGNLRTWCKSTYKLSQHRPPPSLVREKFVSTLPYVQNNKASWRAP